jgi:hypothetical protein
MNFSDYVEYSNLIFQKKEEEMKERYMIEENKKKSIILDKINKYIVDNNLIELHCDCYCMNKYYYNKESNKMYVLEPITPTFTCEYNDHVAEINNLTKPNNAFDLF